MAKLAESSHRIRLPGQHGMGGLHGPNNEKYETYYLNWCWEQGKHTQELLDALQQKLPDADMQKLVDKAFKHYETYYTVKDKAAKEDVVEFMSAKWRTPLEKAFMWLGGWRPCMVFQLGYAQAGQSLEEELSDFLKGIDSPSLASLTASQLTKISDAQLATKKEEDELSGRLALLQQGLADQPLLKIIKPGVDRSNGVPDAEQKALEEAMQGKLQKLELLLVDADALRLKTLARMLSILSPTQQAQYLIAAAELFQALRKLGETPKNSSSAAMAAIAGAG
eukprot:jgi/Mesen1/653/ME000109S10872